MRQIPLSFPEVQTVPQRFEDVHPEAAELAVGFAHSRCGILGAIHQPRIIQGRNEACACESGRKYKRCCLTVPDICYPADQRWTIRILQHPKLAPEESLTFSSEDVERAAEWEKTKRENPGMFKANEPPHRLRGGRMGLHTSMLAALMAGAAMMDYPIRPRGPRRPL